LFSSNSLMGDTLSTCHHWKICDHTVNSNCNQAVTRDQIPCSISQSKQKAEKSPNAKLYNCTLHIIVSHTYHHNIIRAIKSERIKWVGQVECMWEIKMHTKC
jgi:hypothetical protein